MQASRYLPLTKIFFANFLFLPLAYVIASDKIVFIGVSLEFLMILAYSTACYRRETKFQCTKLSKRCEQNPRNMNYCYDKKGWNTPECCATHLVQILFFTCELLEKEGIPYFICYGTLLGAIRNNGLIPWDTDCDIAVAEKDVPELRKLAWRIIAHGFWIYEHDRTFTIQYSAGGINSLHTDIYLYRTSSQGKVHYDDNQGHDPNDVYPFKKYLFYDRELWGPQNGKKILFEYYGENCLQEGYKKHQYKGLSFPIAPSQMSSAGIQKPLW